MASKMTDYSVRPMSFGWRVIDNRTGKVAQTTWTQRDALFAAHRLAWIDNVRKMAAPIPGARVEVRRPRIYRAFTTKRLDTRALGPKWQDLMDRATTEFSWSTPQGPISEVIEIAPWVPREKWEAAADDWHERAQRQREALMRDPRLVKYEKTDQGHTFTLRLEPGEGFRSVWMGPGVAGAVDGDGKTSVAVDPAFGQLQGTDPATAAEIGIDWSNPVIARAKATSEAWLEAMRVAFAGADLQKSSKQGTSRGLRADLEAMDEADYSGRLAEVAEKHYGTRDFKF